MYLPPNFTELAPNMILLGPNMTVFAQITKVFDPNKTVYGPISLYLPKLRHTYNNYYNIYYDCKTVFSKK